MDKDTSVLWNSLSGVDLIGTGRHLRRIFKGYHYSVRDIQNMLQLSCPQPIYRWMKGQALPSVDHLSALSRALRIHIDDLLIFQCLQQYRGRWWENFLAEFWVLEDETPMEVQCRDNRMTAYWKRRYEEYFRLEVMQDGRNGKEISENGSERRKQGSGSGKRRQGSGSRKEKQGSGSRKQKQGSGNDSRKAERGYERNE